MLSLFSSVGICRILRYGSSNTSAVEQQVCPRFFSGPSKFGEMRRCERKMLKCNAELVDIVFRLMFETFWVAPYDLRRLFRTIRNSCGMPAPPGPCDRRSQGFCHAPSPSLGITALRDFLGGSAKAGKTGVGLKRNGPRLGNEFPAGPDAF